MKLGQKLRNIVFYIPVSSKGEGKKNLKKSFIPVSQGQVKQKNLNKKNVIKHGDGSMKLAPSDNGPAQT